MESLEACAGPPAIYLLAEMPKQFFTPETPVGATALAIIGETWRNLANIGESWQILANLGEVWQKVDKSWQILLEKTAWHLRSRGQY